MPSSNTSGIGASRSVSISTKRRASMPERGAAASAPKTKDNSADRFTCFLKLPAEIQLMIWDFWRSDQPVLRHYCSVQGDGRLYAALNTQLQKFVKTTSRTADAQSDDPLDPLEYKIRFKGLIKTVYDVDDINVALSPNLPSLRPALCPAYAWVNFAKDLFYVTNHGYKWDNQLRFFHNNIGAKAPRDLEDDHWARRIQHLAMEAPVGNMQARPINSLHRSQGLSQRGLTDADTKDLLRLTGLKTIYVVTRVWKNDWRRSWGSQRCFGADKIREMQDEEDRFGFWDFKKLMAAHYCHNPATSASTYQCLEVRCKGAIYQMKDQLEKLFENRGTVQVKMVAVLANRPPLGRY